ncbi:MAG: DUF58 domain-containing protein [Spirochaetaceae bacterium]|nr:DUF58 domain-containing protein [Spirochaetaceae bacterium]
MIRDDLPSRVRRLHVRSRKLVEGLFAGNYHSVFKGPGLEFNEVRDYQYGDDVRFIDWNVSSRMAAPYSKTFKEERELILFVLVDVSASLSIGSGDVDKREVAGNLFALLALAAVANDDRVGCLLFSDKVESLVVPRKGRRHVLRQISEVLGHRAQGRGSDLALALRTANQNLKRKSIVVILSDFRSDGYQNELALLSRKHDVIAMRLTDPLDKSFPPTGLVELEDPESGKTMMAWGRMTTMRKSYAEFWDDHRRRWFDDCRSVGADTLEVGTDDEPAASLQAFFKRRRGS